MRFMPCFISHCAWLLLLQDMFAVASHRKAAAAQAAGKFKDEIVPVHTKVRARGFAAGRRWLVWTASSSWQVAALDRAGMASEA